MLVREGEGFILLKFIRISFFKIPYKLWSEIIQYKNGEKAIKKFMNILGRSM